MRGGQEGRAKTRRKCGLWLHDPRLCARNFGGVSGQEMILPALVQTGKWRQHSKSIACQEEDVGWMPTFPLLTAPEM